MEPKKTGRLFNEKTRQAEAGGSVHEHVVSLELHDDRGSAYDHVKFVRVQLTHIVLPQERLAMSQNETLSNAHGYRGVNALATQAVPQNLNSF